MMHLKYDITVVGAGPAGATAAYILGKKNHSVLLLDKAHFPRKKLCGGCLTIKTVWLLERIFNETAASLIEKSIVNFQTHRFEVRCRTKLLVDVLSPFPFHFVDRQVYDAFFLQKAKDVGVDVLEGEKVCDIDLNGKANSSTFFLTTSGGRLIETKFLIGADGANSVVRTKLLKEKKIDGAKWQRNLAAGIEVFLSRNGEFAAFDSSILSLGYVRYGYAWIFPNRDRLVVGMGSLTRKNKNLKAHFQEFLSDYNLGSIDSQPVQGHPLPFGNSLSKPFYGNILLVGDAAGLVDPMLGEGIYQAHLSGELAAKAVIESLEHRAGSSEETGLLYLHLLEKHLAIEFLYARRFRWFLYNPLSHMINFRHIQWMDKYFTKFAEVVHGSRTYKWFKRKE
jgi:geranylgeranyl reductase family protein